MDTRVSAEDPANPNKFVDTGHSVITDAHGVAHLFGSDTGVLFFFDALAASPCVTTVEIVGGTRGHTQASG